jgi:CubicO group peptidase (beta-lactamase class C family)
MRLIATSLITLLIQGTALAAGTDQQKVDRLFAAYDKPASPGCALGVIRDGEFIYRKSYGSGSLELGVPLSSTSVFYMASVSKQFTAASIVLAAEQGFLSLDDNIRKYIPELPDYGTPITLRQMLHHMSGLRDYEYLQDLSGQDARDFHSTSEMIELIARQKALNFEPGAEFQYSSSNFLLLGEVVKRATGKPLSVFAAENIFQPLGMAHTRFYDDNSVVVPGRVPAYKPGNKGDFLVDWSTNYDGVGAGGLLSSVDDLLLWDRNFYANRLGNGTLINELQTRGVLNDSTQSEYALGLYARTYRGLPTIEHSGERFGYETALLRFPQQHFTVVCLCNRADAEPDSMSHKVADIYLAEKLQPWPVFPQPTGAGIDSQPRRYAGTYLDPRDRSTRSLTVVDGNLTITGVALKSFAANSFASSSGRSRYVFDGAGSGMKLTISRDGKDSFSGSKFTVPDLNGTALASYAGRYVSGELKATYNLSVENGVLMLRINGNPAQRLDPLDRDEFQVDFAQDSGVLFFQRDKNDHISGLAVFYNYERNIHFDKID